MTDSPAALLFVAFTIGIAPTLIAGTIAAVCALMSD